MIGFLRRLFARSEPVLSEAGPRDAAAIAQLHAASFHRGWSDTEIERLLLDRHVLAHRAISGRSFAGFILSRMVTDEAEILSVAVAARWRGRGLARRLLDLHLRRLAGLGTRSVFLEVDEGNAAGAAALSPRRIPAGRPPGGLLSGEPGGGGADSAARPVNGAAHFAAATMPRADGFHRPRP